jgi:ankyrin repeat protein
MFNQPIQDFSRISKKSIFEIPKGKKVQYKGKTCQILYEKIQHPIHRLRNGLAAFVLTLCGGIVFPSVRNLGRSALFGKVKHYVNEETIPPIVQQMCTPSKDKFEQTIQNAIKDGNKEAIQDFLRFENGINFEDSTGFSLLHLAVLYNKTEIIEVLLKKGAKLEKKTKEGDTALQIAILGNNLSMVRFLLEKGASLDERNSNGLGVLHTAVTCNSEDMIQLLLEKGADINAKAINDLTPLHIAVSCNKKKMVQLLLKKGADINAKAINDFTPLHLAVSCNSEEMIQLLLEAGADIEEKNNKGFTVLHLAVSFGNKDLISVLLKREANIEAKTHEGSTALHLAVRCNSEEMIQLLLEGRADINAKAINDLTPLHIAVSCNKKKMVQLLLEEGADINAKAINDLTPLHLAVSCNKKEMVQFLLEKGANIEAATNKGFTALHLAVKIGNEEIVKLLIDNKININARTQQGSPAFLIAYANGWQELGDQLYKQSSPESQAFLWHKLINHRFGLNIKIQENQQVIKLEGFFSPIVYFHLLESIKASKGDWVKQAPSNWTDQDTEAIIKTMERAFNSTKVNLDIEKKKKEALESYLNEEIVVIPTGFYEHATMAVFYKHFVAKGDRANSSNRHLNIYQIGNPLRLNTIFKKLFESPVLATKGNEEEAINYYYSGMNHELQLKEIHTVKKSKQHGGVCTWASAKLSFHGALYLYLHKKKGFSKKEALNYSQKMYKAWMQEDRLTALKGYIATIPDENPHKTPILARIYQQMKRKKNPVPALIEAIERKAPNAVQFAQTQELNLSR